MNKFIKHGLLLIAPLCLLIFCLTDLRAEFYKYVDEKGNIFYVDDIYSIPEKYRNQIRVYREKYDGLAGEERSRALQRESEDIRKKEIGASASDRGEPASDPGNRGRGAATKSRSRQKEITAKD